MNVTCVTAVLLIGGTAISFGATPDPAKLRPMLDVIKLASITLKMSWEMWSLEPSTYAPRTGAQAQRDFRSLLADTTKADDDTATAAERPFLIKYGDRIDSLLGSMRSVGGDPGLFFYPEGYVPIRFVRKDGDACLLVSGFASGTVFNTLRTTASSRAAEALTKYGTALISELYEHFKGTRVAYLGALVVFGSKDFSDKHKAMNERGEAICLVAPLATCGEFSDAEMSESEFLRECALYSSDRDMVAKIKKIDYPGE